MASKLFFWFCVPDDVFGTGAISVAVPINLIGTIESSHPLQGIALHVLPQSKLVLLREILRHFKDFQNQPISISVHRQIVIQGHSKKDRPLRR